MDKRFLEYLKCINSQVHLFFKNEKKKRKKIMKKDFVSSVQIC